MAESVARLREAPVDEVADERARLTAMIADLDKRIRATGAQVVAGVLDQEDAVAMNAPLREQRDLTKLQLAALPAKREEPGVDEIDAEAFRAAVLEAWTDQPLEERRSALAQLLRQVTLSPGSVKITYGYCHHEPAGPPEGSGPTKRGWATCPDVSPPKRPASPSSWPPPAPSNRHGHP